MVTDDSDNVPQNIDIRVSFDELRLKPSVMDVSEVVVDVSDKFFKDMKLETCNKEDDGFCFLVNNFKFRSLRVLPDIETKPNKEDLTLEYDF